MEQRAVDKIILNALEEDIGSGDITTNLCIPPDARVRGTFIAKERGVVCGLDVARRVFELVDGDIKFEITAGEGSTVPAGSVIARIGGNARNILKCERVALNLLQRMSGIATATAEAVKAVEGTKVKITDTRKTTPGLRILEKYAVRVGGGHNHRFNLADGILIKDNHIAAAGGISNAVRAAKKNAPHTLKIEVEVSILEDACLAAKEGADIIMFDNMGAEEMKTAAFVIGGKSLTEASGNMGDKNLTEIAISGVDIISIGALTHRIRALDISLKLELGV